MAVYGNTPLSEGSLPRYPSCASMYSKLKHAFLGGSLFDIQEVNDIYKTQEVKKKCTGFRKLLKLTGAMAVLKSLRDAVGWDHEISPMLG